MAEYKHQEQDLQVDLQHLANRQQDLAQHQEDLGLLRQAYLQHQAALIAVQELERQRLNQQQQ